MPFEWEWVNEGNCTIRCTGGVACRVAVMRNQDVTSPRSPPYVCRRVLHLLPRMRERGGLTAKILWLAGRLEAHRAAGDASAWDYVERILDGRYPRAVEKAKDEHMLRKLRGTD